MTIARTALLVALFVPAPGKIRGEVHYPACFPPEDLRVCAEPIERGAPRCVEPIFAKDAITYELVLPAGDWRVYSKADATMPGRRAYYTRAVTCGLHVDCSDHAPVVIRVSSGKIVEGVDPDDWWAMESPLFALQNLQLRTRTKAAR